MVFRCISSSRRHQNQRSRTCRAGVQTRVLTDPLRRSFKRTFQQNSQIRLKVLPSTSSVLILNRQQPSPVLPIPHDHSENTPNPKSEIRNPKQSGKFKKGKRAKQTKKTARSVFQLPFSAF